MSGTMEARDAASEIIPFALAPRTAVMATTGDVRLRSSW